MSDQLVKTWQDSKRACEKAESWNNLPNGPRYQNDYFAISVAHSKAPMLTRMGQQSCGGKNYWETEEELNQAILEYLVTNWKKIYPDVIEIMKDKERKSLIACQEYVDNLSNLIQQAKGE